MGNNIKNHCHINSNEDGDRFVGIRADSSNAIVYFPIGYELPKTDAEIRMDIRHLIQVLHEFTTKQDRLLAINRFIPSQLVDFPINAYRIVIEYFLNSGCKYYTETESVYKTATTGKLAWAKTVKKHMPLVQSRKGVSSFIYTTFEVKASSPNDAKLITQINRFCVYEAFERLGWLYIPIKPEKPGAHPDIKTSKAVLISKLNHTNDDKKRSLFQGMLNMLNYMEEETSNKQSFFGTDDFDHVWEKLIDRAFGERDKNKYFPRSRWLLDYDAHREKRPLMPDTIMIFNDKYYVLDAKCYRYGRTGNPNHLPDASSINKQITYGEYLRNKGVNPDSLYNAFIMPFNKENNHFSISDNIGNIGEAIGDWRNNTEFFERIQGIVMDTRYLMYHYFGNLRKEKQALANCIELVAKREPVPPVEEGFDL
ncbi:MAG: LlaJI family restriction endonuclease [Thermoguttaceae bacterium]|nr:LlaJI family restriction endonuclease [Thermoguttaceae bacterium]MBQ6615832.1 LlaJI family restriction endonuclease [Thermoguttaceae bacterium]